MTPYETYKYLESIGRVDAIIDNMKMEHEQLFTIATKTTQAGDGMPHAKGTTSDKVGNLATELVELEKEIHQTILLLYRFKREATSYLQKLEKDHYKVLYGLYVQGHTYKDIEYREDKSRQWVHNTKKRAVEELSTLITEESSLYEKIKQILE